MNRHKIFNLFIGFCFTLISFFTVNANSYASDYQYKILDPKYNPQAQELLDGKLNNSESYYKNSSKNFDASTFFALFALIIFPISIMSIALKTFKKFAHLSKTPEQKIGNIKININDTKVSDDNRNTENIVSELFSLIDKDEEDIQPQKTETTEEPFSDIKHKAKLAYQTATIKRPSPAIKTNVENKNFEESHTEKQIFVPQKESEQTKETKALINKFFSSSIEKKTNPMLLHTYLLSSNKGLCVVEYNKKYSLIGYINEEVFFLEQFESIKSSEIRSRLTESKNSTDRYVIKVGEHKSLVEVSEKEMKMVLEL